MSYGEAEFSREAELSVIADMIEAASSEGMLVEVVWSFGEEMKSGKSLGVAASNALYEWDI